jgi:hypothetical protein
MYRWEYTTFDPVRMYTAYQSSAGILLCPLRFVFMVVFLTSMYKTTILETDYLRKTIFKQLSVLGSFWFLSYPAIAAIAWVLCVSLL